MNELDILKVIHNNLTRTDLLGDDCACLSDIVNQHSLYVTHDTLVEDVHFSLDTISPYQLGVKAVSVNVSDLCAALAFPKYISISLSMPADISDEFVSEFYRGINDACIRFGCCVCGGDLTRCEKIVISICAIGQKSCNTKVGRDCANEGDVVVLCGYAGASAIGLMELKEDGAKRNIYTNAHLVPKTAFEKIKLLSDLSMPMLCAMDTSDGLADAVFKISLASNKVLKIDGDKIPVPENFKERCEHFNVSEMDMKLFGGEDFALLLTLSSKFVEKLKGEGFCVIGKVGKSSKNPVSSVVFGDGEDVLLTESRIKECTFNHFGSRTSLRGENVK